MIRLLRALVDWCDLITALVIFSKDLNPHDRAQAKLRLIEIKNAVREYEEAQ